MTSRCWRLFQAEILMTWWFAQISRDRKICAGKNSPSIVWAAGPGSASCSGWNILASIQRDQILLQSVDDQGVQRQTLESGGVDAVFVDGVYSKLLIPQGLNILAESGDLKQPLVSQSTIVPR